MTHKKILIISISSLLAAALIALIVMVSLLSDNTDVRSAAAREDTQTLDERMSFKLSDALAETGETGEIDLTFGEEDFNLLLNAAVRGAGSEAFRGIAVTVEEDNLLRLALGVSYAGIQTVLRADIALLETDASLLFTCTNLRLGKLKLSAANANSFAGKFLEKSALLPSTSAENGRWLIRFDKKMLAAYLSDQLAEGENLDLVRVALERCFYENGMLSFRFGTDRQVGAKISLDKLSYQSGRDGETVSDIAVESLNEKLEALLNRGALDIENVNLGAKFLIMGYLKLSYEEKQLIHNIDFSSIGIASNPSYLGMIEYDERTLSSIVLEHLPTVLPLTGEVFFRISEEDLNALVLQSDVIGSAAVFARFTGAGYQVSSVVLESFHAEIRKDTLIINFILSVNGKRLIFSATMESLPTHITSITISMKDVHMGALTATEGERAAVYSMIESVFAAQSWIVCDKDAQTVTFDFESAVSGNWLLHLAFSRFGGIITTSLEDEGYIKVAVEL